MNRVSKTLLQCVALLVAVMSPVTASATRIATDFEFIPKAIGDELVAADEDVPEQASIDAPDATNQPKAGASTAPEMATDDELVAAGKDMPEQTSIDAPYATNQSKAGESTTSEVVVQSAESVPAVVKSSGIPALQTSARMLGMPTAPTGISFSSPSRGLGKSRVSFMSNTPTLSFGSGSSGCCDLAGGGDNISSLVVFAQPSPFTSAAGVGSLTPFTSPTSGFSQSLASPGGQSYRGRARGADSRTYGASSGSRNSAENSGAAQLSSASAASACRSEGSVVSDSGPIMAVVRMIKTFANCLIFNE